jgi:hypothetical protein
VTNIFIFWRSRCFGGNFGAKPGEFFASQRRDGIIATSYGDAIGGLCRVRSTAASA